jgi:hypothetical protein
VEGFSAGVFRDVSGEHHHDVIQFDQKVIVVVICGDVTNLCFVGVMDGLFCCNNRNADTVMVEDDVAPELDVSQYKYIPKINKTGNLSDTQYILTFDNYST